MTRIFKLAENVDLHEDRTILSLVETIFKLDPNVEVYSIDFPGKTEYESINWINASDKSRFSEDFLEQKRVELTKEAWATQLMIEANQLQEAALALHTITDEKPLHQKSMYDIKYENSVKYVGDVQAWQSTNATEAIPTEEQVTVPPVLSNEAKHTGDPVYYLALAIINNFQQSQETLKAFYGEVEGIRRVKKREIVNCTTVEELENLQWVTWPAYEGDPPNPTD